MTAVWRRPLGKTFIASGAIQALNVIAGVLLARGLGPHGRGELAAILLWTMLVGSVGQLGLPEALTYETASNREKARSAVGTAVAAWLVLSVALVTVGGVVLTLTLGGYDTATRTSGYLLLSVIPLYLATNLCVGVLQGLRAYGAFNVIRTLVPAATAVCLVGVELVHGLTVRTAALSYVATYLTTAIVGVALLRRTRVWDLGFDRSLLRRLLAYGMRSQSTFMTSTLIERLDQLLISLVLGATSLGLYAIAVTLTSATTLAASTVAVVAFPHMAALPSGPQRASSARRFVLLAVAASALITIPMLAVTPQLLDLFFGAAFAGIATVCRVLLLAGVFLAFTQLLVALLRGLGRPLDAGAAGVIGLAVTVVLLAVLLPTLGLMGAAIASLVSYAVTAWWMLRKVCSALALTVPQFLLGSRSVATLTELA
jgi:O-antigen/teichoic acid export membrane protein